MYLTSYVPSARPVIVPSGQSAQEPPETRYSIALVTPVIVPSSRWSTVSSVFSSPVGAAPRVGTVWLKLPLANALPVAASLK